MGLIPPVFDNGSLLVDGGYVNNLPIDVMRDMAPQLSEIVAVDVENKDNSALENVSDFGDSLSVCALLEYAFTSMFAVLCLCWSPSYLFLFRSNYSMIVAN